MVTNQALERSKLTAAEAAAVTMVLDGLPSEHSRRAYERALFDFFHWHRGVGRPHLNKAVVQRYAAGLREAGMSPSSVNQRLSAIRKLAAEAADNGFSTRKSLAASGQLKALGRRGGVPATG